MKLRRIISLILLAVYLTAGGGYALSVTLCHCSHSEHFQEFHAPKHHCCSACLSAHKSAENEAAEAIVDNSCGCSHNHSNEITLYDIPRSVSTLDIPVEHIAIITPLDHHEVECDNIIALLGDRRNTPLAESPERATSALRAPPVFV